MNWFPSQDTDTLFCTQYHNRNMFKLIVIEIPSRFPFYNESSHRKGAPDGLGGTLKRTADLLVARAKDINNFDQFFNELQRTRNKSCAKISYRIPKFLKHRQNLHF